MSSRRRSTFVILGLLLLAIGGCTEQSIRRLLPPETEQFAKAFLDSVRVGSTQAAQRLLAPPLDTIASVQDSLTSMRSAFPPGGPDSVDLVDFGRITFSGQPTRTTLVYQYRNRAGAALAQLVVVEEGSERRIESARVNRLAATLQEANAFTLAGKGLDHYIVLVLMAVVVGFSVVTAVRVARTRGMPRRWLWAFVACIGVTRMAFNWTTGAVGGQLISIQLLGAGATRVGLLGPWILAVSFPAGALWALERRQHHLRATNAPSDSPMEAMSKSVSASE